MLHCVLQCFVVNAVAVMIVDTLTPVAGVSVDLLRRGKWWLCCSGVVSGFFAFYRYAKIAQPGSDRGLLVQ
jgi:hypothetical protein